MERVKRTKLAELLRKDYVQTVVMILIVIASVFAFWYGLRFVLQTEHPLLYVDGTSMHPTLDDGDLILVQGVQNSCLIHAAPKNTDQPGDILIFHNPSGRRIVHRAIEKIVSTDGSCSFKTQGDANSVPDGWEVRESDIIGRYAGIRMPWLGKIALFFEPLQVKVAFIMLWIIVLIVLELFPLSKEKAEENQTETKPL